MDDTSIQCNERKNCLWVLDNRIKSDVIYCDVVLFSGRNINFFSRFGTLRSDGKRFVKTSNLIDKTTKSRQTGMYLQKRS